MKKSYIIGLLSFLFIIFLPHNVFAMWGNTSNPQVTNSGNTIYYSYHAQAGGFDAQRPNVFILRTYLVKDGDTITQNEERTWRGSASADIEGSFTNLDDGNYGVLAIGVATPGGRKIYSRIGSCTIGNVPYYMPWYEEKAIWDGTVAKYDQYDYMGSSQYVFDLYKDGVLVESVESETSSCDMAAVMARYGSGRYRFILNVTTDMGVFTMGTPSRPYGYTSSGGGSNNSSNEDDEKDSEKDESTTDNSSNKDVSRIPSTLPSNTILLQADKLSYDLKALDPSVLSETNHGMLANYLAKTISKKAETVFIKDVYAPWGKTNYWKQFPRTLTWNNLGVKPGDVVYAIWYCEEAHKGAQIIRCVVDENGAVIFNIPQLGEVSTISIVRVY